MIAIRHLGQGLDHVTIYVCSKKVAVHVDQHCKTHVGTPTLAKAHLTLVYIHATTESPWLWLRPKTHAQEDCRIWCCAVNRQQHSYSHLEGGNDWSVSGIVHLLHSSASPSAHRNQSMSPEIDKLVWVPGPWVPGPQVLRS